MPVTDSHEATWAIRTMEGPTRASVPVVAMTANAFKEDKNAAMEAGMQDHIVKPVDAEILMKTLHRILPEKSRKES